MEPAEDLPAHDQPPLFVPIVVEDPVTDVPQGVAQPPPIQPRVRAVRGAKFTHLELINLMEIMISILPIGPTEWEQVWEHHNVTFPGRDVNGLRRKYTTLHRKKIPTGDPNMPDEVHMAKQCKYRIAQKAELGDGTGAYDMMVEESRADDDPEEGVPLDDPCNPQADLVPAPPTNNRGTLSPRRSNTNDKQDFLALMAMQMQSEAAQRAHEAREQAASRAQMQSMILGLSTAYFGSLKSKKKRKRKNSRYYSLSDSSSSSSDSSTNFEDDEENDDDYGNQKPSAKSMERSAD